MKASDNTFAKLKLAEGAAPATPDAGEVALYAKTGGLLYAKDDAGAETLVSTAYDNTASGLAATTMQAAIDELAAMIAAP